MCYINKSMTYSKKEREMVHEVSIHSKITIKIKKSVKHQSINQLCLFPNKM